MKCKFCGEAKSFVEFAIKRGKPWKCKDCHNAYQREYYSREGKRDLQHLAIKKHREAYPYRRRALMYGISVKEVERLLSGTCGICENPATVIDHDHETGIVRGGLCHSCNTGLGKLGDNIEGLMRAIEYLSRERIGLVL